MAASGGREMNRAERFEDEKRRIIDSCFNKRDEEGSIIETYITHIRILEYASHPTTPPPPQARTPQSEKHRVIIVAVRKSGRVRVHKSKENQNGTFSIGKTWDLNDLSAIESYTSPNTSPDFRLWAGNVGFLITLGKPYYWQAQTDKEKKFFISSLLKIYGKYSGGKVPVLSGFDQHELDQIQGGAQRRAPPAPTQTMPPHAPPPLAAREPVAPPSTGSHAQPEFRSNLGVQQSNVRSNGGVSPTPSIDSGRSANQNALRPLAGSNKSQESVAVSTTARSDDGSAASIPSRPRNGPINGTAPTVFGRSDSPIIPVVEKAPPPERKRPPMDPSRPQGMADDGLVPAPLMSSMRSRDGVVPPPRSSNRAVPLLPDTNKNDMLPLPLRGSPNGSASGSVSAASPSQPLPAATAETVSATIPEPAGQSEKSKPTEPVASESLASVPLPGIADNTPAVPPQPEETRPGLGPMIKKKSKGDIAGAFWKAAAAANAFKPRPGGAGERLRQAQNKSSDGPDGITSVVPAPPRPVSLEKLKPAGSTTLQERPKTPQRSSIPEVKITVPNSSRPSSLQASSMKEAAPAAPPSMAKPDATQQPTTSENEASRKSVVVGNDVRYLATLGIDPTIMDKRAAEFAKWLDYFGWVPGERMRALNMEEMKIDLDRELNRAQAGGWLARFEEEDERVEAIKKGIDLSIDECEELDNLLTLYSVELSTLSEDIAYIEAQGQGLQVQAANQKLLMKELESLLDTCAITSNDLDALRSAPLETLDGIEQVESALVTLFKAMTKIDPSMGSTGLGYVEDASNDQAVLNSDFGRMRIVREKKEMYISESDAFMRRLVIFMASEFDVAFAQTRKAMESALSRKVDPRNHEAGRDVLWKYNPLILYAREADLANWDRIMQIYQDKSHPLYKPEFRDVLDVWKKNTRKPMANDDSEILFTALQEKKEEGIATTARKLTVKRSQTLARSLRSPLGDSRSNIDKVNDSRSHPYEVFSSVLDEVFPLVQMEQNFIIDFFHATTLEQADFADVVAATRPKDRRGVDLRRTRPMEPDRELARRVTRAMEAIFSFFEQDLQNLIDWVLSMEALQGIGVLATLERKLVDITQSNQDFLNNILQKLHGNLEGRFKKFVDEQIRAIEETKVKINKRKGVIGFMRIFPNFSTAVENMLVGVDPSLNVCRTVDREYDRILHSMFDSLKIIARENPALSGAGPTNLGVGAGGAAAAAAGGSTDPEDKEALNFHILLIENMNHYLEDVENPRGNQVLDHWKEAAAGEFQEHMNLYLNAVMRRPLGKLLEYLENVEAQLASGKAPSAVAAQPSNSKALFNKVLSNYDGKEVRKGVETLRKRVEKHFGNDDDSSVSRGLVNRVLRECEIFYGDVERRIGNITTNVYGGDVLYEWPRADVKVAFAGK